MNTQPPLSITNYELKITNYPFSTLTRGFNPLPTLTGGLNPLLLAVILLIACVMPAGAQFFYNETCREATGVFSIYGDAPGYTAGLATNPDPQGDGWLRLTNNSGNQRGYVRLDKTYPSTMGVTVEFDFKVWGPSMNGAFADGFSVFLYDGDPAKTFQIGGAGGGLGYLNLKPAYLGIGIDEYGNFSGPGLIGGPGRTLQSIAIGDSSYYYRGGTGQNMGFINKTVSYTAISSTRPDDAIYYRRVRIEIEPVAPATGMDITVSIRTEGNAGFDTVIGPVNVPEEAPPVLGLGFAGVTGGSWAYHEVRDVIIRTPGSLSVYRTADCANSKDNVTFHTHVIHGYPTNTQNIIVRDTMPAGYTPAGIPTLTYTGPSASIGNFTQTPLGDGRLLCTYSLGIEDISEATVTYTGSFAAMPPQGEYRSGVSVTLPQGFNDINLNDNQFSLTARIEGLEAATLVTQPFAPGDSVTFGVSATRTADMTCRWKVSSDKINWTEIAGSNALSYTTPALSGGDAVFYRCVAEWRGACRDSVLFTAIPMPDNVSDAECFVPPTASAWGLDSIMSNENNLSPYQNAVVGDIDNDGVVEIIVAMDPVETSGTTGTQDRPASKIAIYKGNNIQQAPFVFETDTTFSWDRRVKYGIVKTKIAGRDTCLIVVAEKDRFLRAYNHKGEKVWTSSHVYNAGTAVSYANSQPPGFTDFNHDGIPEVALSGKLFNSVDGALLCQISSAAFPVEAATVIAADVFNTGEQQYIVGNSIYNAVTNSSNVITGLTLNKTITLPTVFTGDPDDPGVPIAAANGGVVLPVDVDNDGQLDLVGSWRVGSPDSYTVLYIADPVTGSIKARKYIPDAGSSSYPFAGDIDGDGMVEIVIIKSGTADSLYAFKYVPGNPVLQKFWSLLHTDGSGGTGITLFDFDRDGKAELVYRDEHYLRIIDGSANSPYPDRNKAVRLNRSGTSAEYPVVADVDGDGQAEIIIVGGLEAADGTPYYLGRLWVYKSLDPINAPWAPARKVWNQYAYNVVNVNEDLSVPRYPLNPATVFAGGNSTLGDGDDVRPYNAFLQQTTALNRDGTPLWLAPKGEIAGKPVFEYAVATDVLTVRLRVHNAGDAAFQPPFMITVYRENAGNAQKHIFSWPHAIVAGETVEIAFDIPDFKQSGWTTPLAVQINDSGDENNNQPVCDDSGRDLRTGSVIAVNDRATVVKNSSDNKIAVSSNDLRTCTLPVVEIIAGGNPKHGTVNTLSAGDTVIVYKPAAGYVGRDTVTYRILCPEKPADIDTAVVYINVVEMPDNIDNCYIDPPVMTWGIRELMTSPPTDSIDNSCIPLVGDIDNDGKTEIVVLGKRFHAQYTNHIYIFEVDNNQIVRQQVLTNLPALNRVNNPYAIASVDGGEYAALFVCTSHYANPDAATTIDNGANARRLRKYTYNPATGQYQLAWQTADVYSARTDREMGQPVIVDFNGDGVPEVLVLDKVFNSRTGALLVDGGHLADNSNGFGFGGHLITVNRWVNGSDTTWSSIMAVGDIDGDNIPEVIGGKTVYRVSINNPDTQDGSNTFTVLRHVNTSGHSEAVDGPAAIADMNGDGLPEVAVTGNLKTGRSSVYVWNPRTGDVLHTNVIDTIPRIKGEHSASVAFIGDIDGDGAPEICLTGYRVTKAYEFDPVAKQLTEKWSIATNDASAATSLVMFDFDQDGARELVYRDITHLRILNGSDGSDKAVPIECPSETGNEYPVVADVNNDQAAEIVVTGMDTLRIFGSLSAADKWSPTRRVWNQFAYNAVNVNEDLTVPKVQLNPATAFSGDDELLGTADDKYPYNGYLMQITTLHGNGAPIWLTPNGQTVGKPEFEYAVATDVLTVRVTVGNTGDAAFQPPFRITVYEDSVGNPQKYTCAWPHAIAAGDTVEIVFHIPDFRRTGWTAPLAVRINDSGDGNNDQPVCDDSERDLRSGSVIASDDRTTVVKNSSDNKIAVTANDLRLCSVPTVEIIAGGNPKHGTVNTLPAGDTVIVYKPAAGYAGRDTVTYRIYCGAPSAGADTATVYINVMEMPDNVSGAECFTLPPPGAWSIEEADVNPQQIFNGQTPMAGDIDNDGIIEIIIPGTSGGTGLYVYKGNDLAAAPEFIPLPRPVPSKGSYAGLVRTKISATQDTTLIVTFNSNRTLSAYNCYGTELWTTAGTVADALATFGFADFNGDGYVEIYIGNTVIDAAAGTVLCSGGANSRALGAYYDGSSLLHSSAAGDVLNNGRQQLVAGNQVYEVNIVDRTVPASNSMNVVKTLSTSVAPAAADGPTFLLDLNLDGLLDVLVMDMEHTAGADMYFYVWTPSLGTDGSVLVKDTVHKVAEAGLPFIGDIDGDGYPEILMITGSGTVINQKDADDRIHAFKYVPGSTVMNPVWTLTHTDGSGHTGMTLFDFNQDGIAEIIYRDQDSLRVINGSGKSHLTGNDTVVYNLFSTFCMASTWSEMPVVADIDSDGHAEIVTAGQKIEQLQQPPWVSHSPLRVFKGHAPDTWAPARKVWNQYCYNPVYINDDLTVPTVPLSPATAFPGDDGILGTADDVRPYNNFLQQQTMLSAKGSPLWLTPDAVPDEDLTVTAVSGDTLRMTVGIINQGDAALGSPVHVSFYRDSISAASRIATVDSAIQINPGDTGHVTLTVPDVTAVRPFTRIVARINDDGTTFPYQTECDTLVSDITLPNPAVNRYMQKHATLNGVQHDGRYANPVSVLYSENIEYKIAVVNTNLETGNVFIIDTLPPYLEYVEGSGYSSTSDPVNRYFTGTTPQQTVLEWTSHCSPLAKDTVSYEATPASGAVASQPFFINHAWVRVSDTIFVRTNSTYHQGAGVSVVTFSASAGGRLYNTEPQALDYRTSPRAGVLAVADSGYVFAGWSHDEYISLKGEKINADSGIMHCGDIVVYGNVELRANFVPEGQKPIDEIIDDLLEETGDNVWANGGDLYIRTKKGAIARIYSPDGILRQEFTVTEDGTTTVRLERGIYIVTLNGGAGYKVIL